MLPTFSYTEKNASDDAGICELRGLNCGRRIATFDTSRKSNFTRPQRIIFHVQHSRGRP